MRDDRMLGNGFITPDFSALAPLFEFSHSLGLSQTFDCGY
jgi:hypothetical protein